MERASRDAAAGRRPVAPWLPSEKPARWRRRLLKLVQVIGALLLLLYIMVVGLLLLLLEIPKAPVRVLMKLGMQGFGSIVEHAYALPICKLHVTFSRLVQRNWNHRPYHTRYADIRTEIPLPGGGICFIHAVPCMTDNFCYVLVDATSALSGSPPTERGLPACAVDPCDAFSVAEALELIAERYYAEVGGLRLEAVLCTHRHWDHAGGNEDLIHLAAVEAKKLKEQDSSAHSERERRPMDRRLSRTASMSDQSTTPLTGGAEAARPLLRYRHPLRVYGGAEEGTPGCTHALWHGNTLKVGTLVLEALASPGHTKGSLMFRLVNGHRPATSSSASPSAEEAQHSASLEAQPSPGVLFTGDTLFSGGCGAQFEGCELDIEHCFATVLACCDAEDALLFPGHEYTGMLLEHRLTDALEEWAGIEAPGQFLALCGAYYVAAHRRCLRDKVPTVPFMLKSERLINPHFDRSLLRHADVILAMLDAQTGTCAIGPATGAGALLGGGGAAGPPPPPARTSSPPRPGPSTAAAASPGQDSRDSVSHERADELAATAAVAAAADPDSVPDTAHIVAVAPRREETGPLLDSAAEPGGGAAAGAASSGAAEAAGSGAAAAASGSGGGNEAASAEKAEAAGGAKSGYFATGSNAPAFQFAFLYKQDLDALRDELLQDRLTGPEAAARLLECERRLFGQSLLTGPGDCFCGEGVEPWEEDNLSDEEGQVSAPSSAVPAAGAQAQDAEGAEERSEEPSWDARWPSEVQVRSALKVLGVLPEVPIGPKAPCADEDLPVSLLRLETVLQRLNVSEEHLHSLRQTLQKEDVFMAGQAASAQCFLCSEPSRAWQDESRRQMQADNAEEGGEVLPLRQVMQLLRPTPLRDRSSMERCFRQSMRLCREVGHDIVSLFRPQPESSAERPAVATTPRSSEDPSRDKGRQGPEIIDGADLTGKRRRAVERAFTAHALDQCPLCSCAFQGRPGAVRRSSFGSQQE